MQASSSWPWFRAASSLCWKMPTAVSRFTSSNALFPLQPEDCSNHKSGHVIWYLNTFKVFSLFSGPSLNIWSLVFWLLLTFLTFFLKSYVVFCTLSYLSFLQCVSAFAPFTVSHMSRPWHLLFQSGSAWAYQAFKAAQELGVWEHFLRIKNIAWAQLVWLRGLNIISCTKRLLVKFPVRAYA